MDIALGMTGELELTPEQMEYMTKLRAQNQELADSMRRLVSFQEQIQGLRTSSNIEQTFDAMEMLLEDIVEFTYLRIYLNEAEPGEGGMTLAREMCPQEFEVEWDLVAWAISKQEPTFIPIDESGDESDICNLLILPLIGHTDRMGVLLLWVDFDMTAFTHERSMLLNMLARESASVIETIRLQSRVEDARAEMENVVENIPLGLVALDAGGRVTLINGTAEYIFKIRRDEAIGENLGRLLPPNAMSQISAVMRGEKMLEDGELELEMEGQEGDTFGASIASLYVQGTEPEERILRGHVLVIRDLKLSREVAKLRELDTMKNDFLSLVSHELRTPLTSIMAYSETLLMEGMIDTEEERKEYLEIIHSEGERLSRLINDVLDLTKMESGKMEFTYAQIDMAEVIRSGVAAVHSLAVKKDIEMPVQAAEDLPQVKADRDKIIQVLANLYSNAIKFTDEGGSVSTDCYMYEPGGGNSPMVEVVVTDTGMGIAPEDIHKVFSKFEQIEKIDHHSVGTGLGMPIVKQIIEEGHAGKIWIDSEVDVGTKVFFRLPVY